MLFYLDTSILLKLYLDEPDSKAVQKRLKEARAIATSWISYPESRSAFARIRHNHVLVSRNAQEKFEDDWIRLLRVDVSESLLRRAADYCEKHRLRSFDGVHLASVVLLAETSAQPIRFWSADEKLIKAALKEGLFVLN